MPGEGAGLTIDEVAFRLAESAEPNAWAVAVAVASRSAVAARLHHELEQLRTPADAPYLLKEVDSVGALFELVREYPDGTLVVTGASAFPVAGWRSLDANRTRLMRNGTAVLVLDDAAAGRLENAAPNLASWIAGRVWRIADEAGAPALSPDEIEQRLGALRSWAGHGDAELIRRAETGVLPRDPAYAEWLAMLGRGDLLGP